VGKDLIAHVIHAHRRDATVLRQVNCAAIPLELLESELFGHEKGAFTGAHGGSRDSSSTPTPEIFLDEIAELPPALQAKLLHVLQDFRFARVGGHGLIESTRA